MKPKIVPFEMPFYTMDVVGKEDNGKTLAFLNVLHDCCEKTFNTRIDRLLSICTNIKLKKALQHQKRDLYLRFYLAVQARIYQIITPATEDIKDDFKRGKKRLELQGRIDLPQLINEVPLPVSPIVRSILTIREKRLRDMTGKKNY